MKRKSLYTYTITSIGIALILSIVILTILTVVFIRQSVIDEKKKSAGEIARNTFTLIYYAMTKGVTREEIDVMASAVTAKAEYFKTKYIPAYKIMSELEEINNHPEIKKAFELGEPVVEEKRGLLHFSYPIKVEYQCTRCHSERPGTVLGIIEVDFDINKVVKEEIYGPIAKSTLLMILPMLLLTSFVGYLTTRKIRISLECLKKCCEGVSTFKDIHKLKNMLTATCKEIAEFEEIRNTVNSFISLIENLEKYGTDKKILETQVKLLEKFIITTDVIKDWKQYMESFILSVNEVVNVAVLFSLFFTKNDSIFEAEVFWLKNPPQEIRKKLEKFINEKAYEELEQEVTPLIGFTHNVIVSTEQLEIKPEELEFRTKKLIIRRPIIGGVVGVGVTMGEKDPTKEIALEMVLSSLMNLIGSIKAINRYTKDLEFYATRDPLTNVYNQRLIWEVMNIESEKIKRSGGTFSIILVDIDNFRFINDQWGYDFGDVLLQEVASVMLETIRESDIVARYSADEFCILLPETEVQQAKSVAERIKQAIENRAFVTPTDTTLKITVSVAIGTYPYHSSDPEKLFKIVYNTLVKERVGKTSVLVIPTQEDIEEVLVTMGEKTNLLIRAVEHKEVIPYFQKIIDIQTGETLGAEVLMRIVKPNGEIVPAYEFIEIAESSGIINKLDIILIEKTFEKIRETGYDKTIFINLSPKVLIIEEFIPSLRKLLIAYEINPNKIAIEITERDTVKNLSLMSKFVKNLKYEGIKFCIDDFGSGYSSFKYLKMIPIDIIKIDGDFVIGITKNGRVESAVIKSVVSLSESLDILTIAEFIENEEILERCRIMGVKAGQGYFIGKPSPELPT